MEKRIVINDYTCEANGVDFVIAINTKEGTVLNSIAHVKNLLQAKAIVHGYLKMYDGYIEIHPGSVDTWNSMRMQNHERN